MPQTRQVIKLVKRLPKMKFQAKVAKIVLGRRMAPVNVIGGVPGPVSSFLFES